jgi:hypothetical protein
MLEYFGKEFWLHEKIVLHIGADRVCAETG